MHRAATAFVSVIALVAATTVIPTAAAASMDLRVAGDECHSLVILGARGSGEDQFDHGGFGTTVAAVADDITTRLLQVGDLRDVGEQYIDYPADDASYLFSNPGTYFANLNTGARWAADWLVNRMSACPQERYVLVGYSQGAMLMHRLTNILSFSFPAADAERVVGVALVADGDRARHSAVYNAGTASIDSFGAAQTGLAQSIGEKVRDISSSFLSRTSTACNDNDPVCDFTGRNIVTSLPIHLQYAAGDLPRTLADRMVGRIRATAAPAWSTSVATYVGGLIDQTLTAYGFDPDQMQYRWADPSAVPSWLTLTSNGRLTGIPPMPGTWALTVQVAGRDGAWISGALDVAAVLPPPPPDPSPDPLTGPRLVSVNASGAASSYYARRGTISRSGAKVAWVSPSPELDGDTAADCFVSNLVSSTVIQASLGIGGTNPAHPVEWCSISADGRAIAFYAYGEDGLDGTVVPGGQTYLRDLESGTVKIVSATAAGQPGNRDSGPPFVVSADRAKVAFTSNSTNLAGDGLAHPYALYVKNLVTGALAMYEYQPGRVLMSSDGATTVGVEDGASGMPDAELAVRVWNATNPAGIDLVLALPAGSWSPVAGSASISGDGRWVTLAVQDLGVGVTDVILADLQTHTVRVIAQEGDFGATNTSVSDDGRTVVYEATRMNSSNQPTDAIIAWREGAGVMTVSQSGTRLWKGSVQPAISGNGQSVVFTTLEPRVSAVTDTNADIDVVWVPLAFP